MFSFIKEKIKLINIIILMAIAMPSMTVLAEVDPTKPIHFSSTKSIVKVKKSLVLQSIIGTENQRKAVINGRVLRVGDYISHYKIARINRKTVVVSSGKKSITLALFSTRVTK